MNRIVRKKERFRQTVRIFLSIQENLTGYSGFTRLFTSSAYSNTTNPLSVLLLTKYFKNMTYDEIINAVENGAKFTINFQKRTCRVNGKIVMSEEDKPKDTPYLTPVVVFVGIEQRYAAYKHSVPSERSESHRRYYFKALPEKELSDEDMMYGERREVARCKLELYVLMQLLRGNLWWDNSWGTWFWCSKNDKDLIILRDWIEPNKGEV